jgi:hypothetical protein
MTERSMALSTCEPGYRLQLSRGRISERRPPDGWELEVTVGIIHAPPCSAAVLGEHDKRWFDARAFREVR